jgi:hypothetical protein
MAGGSFNMEEMKATRKLIMNQLGINETVLPDAVLEYLVKLTFRTLGGSESPADYSVMGGVAAQLTVRLLINNISIGFFVVNVENGLFLLLIFRICKSSRAPIAALD